MPQDAADRMPTSHPDPGATISSLPTGTPRGRPPIAVEALTASERPEATPAPTIAVKDSTGTEGAGGSYFLRGSIKNTGRVAAQAIAVIAILHLRGGSSRRVPAVWRRTDLQPGEETTFEVVFKERGARISGHDLELNCTR